MGISSFKRALWVFHVATGSCNGCDIEIVAALTPATTWSGSGSSSSGPRATPTSSSSRAP